MLPIKKTTAECYKGVTWSDTSGGTNNNNNLKLNIMTTGDYLRLKEQENKRMFGSEGLNIGEAYKAVKMVREEERENAICAFNEVWNKCEGCKDAMTAK